MQKVEGNNMTIKTSDGKEHEGVWYDSKLYGSFSDSTYISNESLNKKDLNIDYKIFMDKIKEGQENAMLTPNLELTRFFCEVAPSVPQFQARKDFFKRRNENLFSAEVYRFKNSLIKILFEKTINDNGFRRMPYDNMFIEQYFDFGDIKINGIHLTKVYIDDKGRECSAEDNETLPEGFTTEGISIFVTGFDKENTQFFSHLTLDKTQTEDFERKKKLSKYVCAICGSPMLKISNTEYTCDAKSCYNAQIGGKQIYYNLKDNATKTMLLTSNIGDVWKVEDTIRSFVSNFLDYLTNREIVIRDLFDETERKRRNIKRLKNKKTPMNRIKIVDVKGYLYHYLNQIKEEYKNDYSRIQRELKISAHFFRFWNKETWHNLYDLIKNCRTIEQKTMVIKEHIRLLPDGTPYPESQQYEYDEVYDVIKVWKLPAIRNKGINADYKTIRYVK